MKSLLMLSGGKDSCSLAFNLSEEIIAFTYDNGIMSKVAWDNINKVVKALNLQHIIVKGNREEHLGLFNKFAENKNFGMADVCLPCSYSTQKAAIKTAKELGCEKIYTGFTIYSAIANGGDYFSEKTVDGMLISSPHKSNYDLQKLEKQLKDNGIETDPIKTNCSAIQSIIREHLKRRGENPFHEEFRLLLKDNQTTLEQYLYLLRKPFEKRLEDENILLEPFNDYKDYEYLFSLADKYKYNKVYDIKDKLKSVDNGIIFWKVKDKGETLGVLFVCCFNGVFTMDGYRDDEKAREVNREKSHLYHGTVLASEYILNEYTNILWTTHDIRNRGATILAKKAGYKVDKEININLSKFVTMFKRR